MNDDRFMVMAAILLGIVQLLGFYGFDMMAFLVEPVCHSVRERCPDCIIEYAGYYGVAILCFSYTIGNLIAPCLLPIFGSQGCLTLSALCFASYAANFFVFAKLFLFSGLCPGRLGLCIFLRWRWNQSITWMVGSVTTLLSGVFQIVTNMVLDEIPDENITTLAYENQAAYRDFSDLEIRILSTGMTLLASGALLIGLSLPKRQIPDCLQQRVKTGISFGEQIGKVARAVVQYESLLLAPFYLYTGLVISIFLTLYPTTLAFTDSLAGEKNTVAYYCIAVTIGEVIVGLIITALNKRVKDFGMLYRHWHQPRRSHFFEPSATVAIILGILCGALDGAANNCRMVSAAKSLPADPAIGFSVSKFYQAIGQTTCLYLGAMFDMHQMILLSASMLIAGIFGYILFLRGLSNRKKKTVKESKKNVNSMEETDLCGGFGFEDSFLET
ncbi:unnamed protein product, partial [Mesorhabditis spiculigera]